MSKTSYKKMNKRFYEDLLKKGKNVVYVWSGSGYKLQEITTNKEDLSIEDLAYICIKSGKGYFRNEKDIQEEWENEDFQSDFGLFIETCYNSYNWVYCDLSEYGLLNGYLNIENLKTFNVEIHS